MEKYQDAETKLMKSGKYAQKTLKEVYETDLNYCIHTLRKNSEYKNYIESRYLKDINSAPEKIKKLKIRRGNVTYIVKELKVYHYLRLFECMGEHTEIKSKQVHEPSSYTNLVVQKRLYPMIGIFYDYIIRKHVYNLKEETARDNRAEHMLSDPIESCMLDSSSDDDFMYPNNYKDYQLDYKIFQHKNNDVLKILPHIYRVSLLHKLFFAEKDIVDYDPEMISIENIKNMLNYISTLPNVRNSLLNPICGGVYFNGDADMVIDETIIDFKVSKFAKVTIENFTQLIFYSAGFYLKDKKTIRKFIIYNPLLGLEHTLELPNLDFEKFISFLEDIIEK